MADRGIQKILMLNYNSAQKKFADKYHFFIFEIFQENENADKDADSPLAVELGLSSEGLPADKHHGHHNGISLFKFQWDHVSAPLTIAFWFFTVTVVKLGKSLISERKQ